jgi:hypothetical protein
LTHIVLRGAARDERGGQHCKNDTLPHRSSSTGTV